MQIEVVDPETFERKRYPMWSSDDRGTHQALVEIAGKTYAVNVYQPQPICEKPRDMIRSRFGGHHA